MGLTYLEIEVANPTNPEFTERLKCLVDSGATYSVIPRTVLERLGIRPITRQAFYLANGETIPRDKGFAVFKFGDHIGLSGVIFGEEGDSNLLGVVTLEELGLVFDPIRCELKRLPMLM